VSRAGDEEIIFLDFTDEYYGIVGKDNCLKVFRFDNNRIIL